MRGHRDRKGKKIRDSGYVEENIDGLWEII